jgi:hypothetical protein
MGTVGLRDVDWVLINRIMEWHREHYLCSTTICLSYEGIQDRAVLPRRREEYCCLIVLVFPV